MFGFLKDKLKGALGKLSKEVEKEAVIEKKEIVVEKRPEERHEKKDKVLAKHDEKDVANIPAEKKKGFFQRIFGKKEEEDIIEEKEELRHRAEKHDTIVEHEEKPKMETQKVEHVPITKDKSKEEMGERPKKPEIGKKPIQPKPSQKVKTAEKIVPEIRAEKASTAIETIHVPEKTEAADVHETEERIETES